MLATLAAGSAVVLFVGGFVALALALDRIAAAAALGGLILLSIAVLAHVSRRERG